MVNVLVTGSNGQLGSEIKEIAPNYQHYNFFFTDVDDLDITNHKAVKKFIESNKINIIINCAAYTAVDKAESELEIADKINHLAVKNFAELSKENNIKLIHISTDYVFDGNSDKPYNETDKPNPQTIYGKTKLDGELVIQKINPSNSIIIRTSWVYSKYGSNFVKTMLKLSNTKNKISVVADQIGSPTNAADLATFILSILAKVKNEIVEIFHFSNEGFCSWYEFAIAIFNIKGCSVLVNPIYSTEYSSQAKRPFYSVLNKDQLKKKFSIEIVDWKKSLISCLSKINEHNN